MEVKIELYRPGDDCCSEPLPFRYKPNPKSENTRKRARLDSNEIPTVVFSHERNMHMETKPSTGNDVSSSCDTTMEDRHVQSPGQRDEINSTVPDIEESIELPDNILQLLDNLNDELLTPGDDGKSFLNPDGKFFGLELLILILTLKFLLPELYKSLFENDEFTRSLMQREGFEIDTAGPQQKQTNLPLILDKIKMLERIFKNDYEEKKMRYLIWDIVVNQSEHKNLLFAAIEQGDTRQIKNLLSILCKYQFVNLLRAKTDNEQNCLHLCVKFRKSELIAFFIGAGLDVNSCDSEGLTPLHLAVSGEYKEAVHELIQNQKEELSNSVLKLDLLNDDGLSPLHMAVK